VSPWECTWHEETVCKVHWPVGPGVGQPAKSLGRPTSFWVGTNQNILDTCLYEKGKAMVVEKVSGGWTHWPIGHVAWPVGDHLASYPLGQVGGTPPWPYKYPYQWKLTHTHTPDFGDSTCKAPIFSVVVRRNLVERVARLWGSEGLSVCQEPSS
jgi:hypothetical protein